MKQLGFAMEYTDPHTHDLVPWAQYSQALVNEIAAAPWKIADVETTGLNAASKEQNFNGKALQRGLDPELRLRVNSVLIPAKTGIREIGFDFDDLTPSQQEAIASATMSKVVFAHNAGFDAYWLCSYANWNTNITLLLDSMLICRILIPQHPLLLARMVNDENEDEVLRKAATDIFMQGRSGWSLADLCLGQLRMILSKEMQGPKNWCEPFLTQQAYDYATGDCVNLYKLLCHVMEVPFGANIAERYEELKAEHPTLTLVEPQVLDIVNMRRKGMPWSEERAIKYVKVQTEKVRIQAQALLEMEPNLEPFRNAIVAMDQGITDGLKQAIGKAFTDRGLILDTTEKTGAFKIGEKDLRKAKAQVTEEAKALFDTWTAISKAKKSAKMAHEVTAFSIRSGDGRLHPNTGHGPVTGRLSSSEPNCQQFPRDQYFRDCVEAAFGHKIVASDYSALDMRVGAALAIRAQQQIFEAYMGDFEVTPDVLQRINRVVEGRISVEAAVAEETDVRGKFDSHKAKREGISDDKAAKRAYWEKYRALSRKLLLARFTRCYAQVQMKAKEAGTPEWGSLRDAFSIDGMDIHSWTALSMTGQDPKKLFENLSGPEVVKELKKWKGILGDKRQAGKVGNLSLLYAMQVLGLVTTAAKSYNIHWTFEEGETIRNSWFATYIEIDLWHAWKELTPLENVLVPDMDKGGKFVRKDVYKAVTLGGREIYAFGLNAALSYEDQSTGADILGTVMDRLRREYPAVYNEAVNQVHDEAVFEIPDEVVEEHTEIIQRVMTECAEKFLMVYGVKGECTPATGQTWVKD